MIEAVLPKIIASTLFFTSLLPTPVTSTPQFVFTQVLPAKNYVAHPVDNGETLLSIAQDYYGDDNYWTTLWNDNPYINDPADLTQGSLVKIDLSKPDQPDELNSNLDKKLALKQQLLVSQGVDIAPIAAPTVPVANTPAAAPAPVQQVSQAPKVLTDEQITFLGSCEAGMNPAKNTGNGYYGAFQFSQGTWQRMNTGYARADLAPIEVQKAAVQQLVSKSNVFTQFPACSQRMRSAGVI